MITLDKNILSFLEIKSVYVAYSGAQFPCVPLEMSENFLRIIAFQELIAKKATIKILTADNSFINVNAITRKIVDNSNQYVVFFVDALPHELKTKIEKIELDNKFSNRRDGKRYAITEINYQDFNLPSNVTTAVICGVELKVTLQDISMHGIRFRVNLPEKIKKRFLDNNTNTAVGLKFQFINPHSLIFLILLVMHFNATHNDFSLGCKIKPPYNREYTRRLIDFLTLEEEKYVLEQGR